jgi:hypothetical protein
LRCEPAFKLACGPLPDNSATDLTISRYENTLTLRALIRLMGVIVDLSWPAMRPQSAAVTFDIYDTIGVVHGHQQFSFFNAHYDERCFLPMHVYDTPVARPVAVLLLRPARRRPARGCAAICARFVLSRRSTTRSKLAWRRSIENFRGWPRNRGRCRCFRRPRRRLLADASFVGVTLSELRLRRLRQWGVLAGPDAVASCSSISSGRSGDRLRVSGKGTHCD